MENTLFNDGLLSHFSIYSRFCSQRKTMMTTDMYRRLTNSIHSESARDNAKNMKPALTLSSWSASNSSQSGWRALRCTWIVDRPSMVAFTWENIGLRASKQNRKSNWVRRNAHQIVRLLSLPVASMRFIQRAVLTYTCRNPKKMPVNTNTSKMSEAWPKDISTSVEIDCSKNWKYIF